MENKVYMLSTKSCSKCPMIKDMLASKKEDIEYVDIEENPDIAIEHMVMSVPTLIDSRNGNTKVYVGQGECMQLVSELE